MSSLSTFFRPSPVVYALVGESGTGKSFRANLLAERRGIEAIVDDGLLIIAGSIAAGRTAKREKTYMAAVRCALFDDKRQRDEVIRAIKRHKVKRLLVVATSEKMARLIAGRLGLPAPCRVIKVEDIATKEEIEAAIVSRQVEGKHAIPVPAIEVHKVYSGIFHGSLVDIISGSRFNIFKNTRRAAEKSIVTPEYSKRGRIEISEAALSQMVMHCVSEFSKDIRIKRLVIKKDNEGYILLLTIDVPFGRQLTGEIYALQQYIINCIEKFTGILIKEVSIIIDKISIPQQPAPEGPQHPAPDAGA